MTSRKTLSELVQEGGTPDEIIATFAYYADRGTAISGRSVSAIVAQVQWQPQQLDAAYASLERGLRNAVLDGKSRDAGDYLYAMDAVEKAMRRAANP